MLRLRFHAAWLPDEHNQFWTVIDCTTTEKTVTDLIDYFNEQQKSFADHYEFHIPKRATKSKYLKAFINDCVLPPHAQANQILRDNDEIDFRLAIDAQDEWLLVKSAPASKRKRSVERESPALPAPHLPPPSPPAPKRKRSVERESPALPAPHPPPPPSSPPTPSNDLDHVLRNIAQPTATAQSPANDSFTFQFGNKRGRPIPPRPQVISTATVNSLVPRQVMTKKM